MDAPDIRPRPQPRHRRPLQDLLSPANVSGLVLAVCLGSTWWLWSDASADAEQSARADFDFRVRELVNNIAQRMQTYVQVLYGVQGLFASSDFVDRDEFRNYLAGQGLNQHFPGIQGVGYMRLVPGTQREAHVAAIRRDGFPDYSVSPDGMREWHAPIVYIEPFGGDNLKAFGFDPLSEPVRRAALELARDTGMPAMSGKIRLVQESAGAERAGFLVALPVYHNALPRASVEQRRAAIQGWVYAPFRTDDVMAGLGSERGASLDVEIYDGDAVGDAARMYDSAPGAPRAGMRHTTQKISIASHRWTVRIAGLPGGAVGAERDGKARLIGLSGVVLSCVLAALAWLLARSRLKAREALERARAMAGELEAGQASLVAMAESAQRSEVVLRSILDSTVDGILVDNFQGVVLNSNRRFRELWNVPEHLDWVGDGAILFEQMAARLAQPQPFLETGARLQRENEERRELLQLKDGRVIEQLTRGLRLGSAPARLWSFRDVTERTLGERREQTRRQVLELLATGAPLPAILESVVQGVEAGNPGMLCAVLLLDEEGRRLMVGAAPSLPPFFNAALDGHHIEVGEGACGQAVLTGTRVIVEDIGSDPLWSQYRDLALRAGLASCWSDPIRGATGKILGTFAVFHREARRPTVAHLAQIEQASRLAGIAIEQAQAGVALRAGEARFRSLYDNAPVALWEQDWSAVRAALQELEQSGVDNIPLYLQNNPSQIARMAGLVRIMDVNAAALAQVGAPPGGKDISALSLAQNFDEAAMPSFGRALAALAQGAHLFACESSYQRLDGVSRQNELTLLVMPGHTQSLDFVIVSTVDITERKRMNDELLVLATTDFLTGLPNRREFMARLDDEQARLQRDVGVRGGLAAVLMLDLDHFKRINDEYGHAAGDAVLRHMAALMRDSQRKIDILGRVGGEEFAVLLPGADLAAAAAFAERLRQRIAGTPLEIDGHSVAVTVSIGIAAMDAADSGGDAALVRADKALYRAKRAGRNRVNTEEDEEPGLEGSVV
ncbi:CHASE domain-containing protein [Pseudoduganella namucuonensis]|uniref:diguanylate cyclase n=1 Tax=Pseudoduganella namucuonensis TaxID=1035707 RepID=A0A1I7IG81_9BURK|nr:CHASE domain-containing protein [Pseudoduganella namucuonensis]SFU71954.1 diguanylate cyclase (GGDEF) domain-containing protein [Pseudoduganella namucuonensis]